MLRSQLSSLFFSVFLLALGSSLKAQIHCGLVEIDPNTSVNQIISFDDFTKYNGGITIQSVARIRIRVENQAIVDPLCSWSLVMSIDNNPGAGTAADEWEELAQYGSGLGDNPPIDLLQVRVRNECTTSPIDGIFQTFTNDGDLIDIIEPIIGVALADITAAGSCTDNVNGPGDYLSNYSEFNFDIDVRVVPTFSYNPGIYNLNINFHLEENQ